MADIKPIETIYNGYKFRSRLEARWAVFEPVILEGKPALFVSVIEDF